MDHLETVVLQSTDCCSLGDKIRGAVATGRGRHDEERLEHGGQNNFPDENCVPRTSTRI